MSSGANIATPVRFCTQCGKPLGSGIRFCNACGARTGLDSPEPIKPPNPEAQNLFKEALLEALAKQSGIPVMPLLQRALVIGLLPKDEVEAHLMLGEGYREIFGNQDLSWQQMVQTNEFQRSMVEVETALELDRIRALGVFAEPLNIGRLQNLDLMYELAADAKRESVGIDAAISYLAQKLKLVEYLATPVLLRTLLKLATLYRERGASQEAVACLQKVLRTSPLYPADQERNDELRRRAHQMLSEIQRNH